MRDIVFLIIAFLYALWLSRYHHDIAEQLYHGPRLLTAGASRLAILFLFVCWMVGLAVIAGALFAFHLLVPAFVVIK